MISDFNPKWKNWEEFFVKLFNGGNYIQIFDVLQYFIRHPKCPHEFSQAVAEALKKGRAAYRIEDKTIIPITSIEEGIAISNAFIAVEKVGYEGARSHLQSAGEHLTRGEWADSVRESIHAIESAVIKIEPKAKMLSDGLLRLEKNGRLNPNLKKAMNSLYDYTSDEKGVRHAKAFQTANVDEWDAVYMFGVCASFLTFIINKYL